MTTTVWTVTKDQLQRLKDEAGVAGDGEQVRLCDLAIRYLERHGLDNRGRSLVVLAAGEAALKKCVEAINAAEAPT